MLNVNLQLIHEMISFSTESYWSVKLSLKSELKSDKCACNKVWPARLDLDQICMWRIRGTEIHKCINAHVLLCHSELHKHATFMIKKSLTISHSLFVQVNGMNAVMESPINNSHYKRGKEPLELLNLYRLKQP